ncbi:hypothetical protein BN946_scf184970.g95 [Trametes cinnabarina]|uniref:Uncharacterized protein n=1 Tax=Pycnoporus cinnabarinus TaxID=5643 RepID=A0A060SIJ0_PYCCI|nr:hypothetical protein BN946_scf184970.g95 [Trametes cinnabarina]
MPGANLVSVTGASSGFRRLLAEIILEEGEKAADISSAFHRAKDTFGRVDVVVNNAAFAALGEVKSVREEDARLMFETNFWGAIHVTREAVKLSPPLLASLAVQDWVSMPRQTLEGFSESLAAEIDPSWNIKVTLVEPAGFETGGRGRVVWGPPHPAYSDPELPATRMRNSFEQSRLKYNACKGAEAFYKIALVDNPLLHSPVGPLAMRRAKKKANGLLADTETYKPWSQDMVKNM